MTKLTYVLLLLFICAYVSMAAPLCGGNADNATSLYFGSLQLKVPSPNPSFPEYIEFQGLRLQLNAANGFLQVVEIANNNVVWGWGLSGKTCSTGSCTAVYQGDGNFVLYYPDGSAIGTSTYGKTAAGTVLTTSPPYFVVINSNCAQIWPSSTAKPTTGPLPRTTPLSGSTFDVSTTTVQSLPAAAWRSHFGVNTHCSQGWSSTMVYNLSTYIGTGAIRDSLPSPSQASDYAKMFAAGIRLNVVAGGVANKSVLAAQVQSWSKFQSTQPGMLLQIEGFNEINNFGFVYNGIDNKNTYAGMAQAQQDLYTLVKSTSNLANIPVIDLTGGAFSDGPKYNLTNYVGHADFGNIHTYPSQGQPSVSIGGGAAQNYFLMDLGGSYPTWRGSTSNYATTETGYHTDKFGNGVTERAQSILIINELLNGLVLGLRQVFVYELWDEYWSGYDGPESHYGLFRHDESPKPSARALHFLSGLLSDTGVPPKGGQLTFGLKNVMLGTQYVVFQNTKTTFFLVLWNNMPVYDNVLQTDMNATVVQVSLTLSTSMQASVYNIYDTTASDIKTLQPISTTVGTVVNFNMGNQAVVISLS